MIRKIEDLAEIWDTLDKGYKRPEKYMTEALKLIIQFRKYSGQRSHQRVLPPAEGHYKSARVGAI
jgi:hypothetical protein